MKCTLTRSGRHCCRPGRGRQSAGGPSSSGSTGPIFWAPLVFAAVLSLAYLVLLACLYINADRIADPHWSRVVYVAGGLGGLVTTAIGWIFGREVHRGTADVANDAAGSARRTAQAARDDAARAHDEAWKAHLKAAQNERDAGIGRALAAGIMTLPTGRDLPDGTEKSASGLSTLQAIAKELLSDGGTPASTPTVGG